MLAAAQYRKKSAFSSVIFVQVPHLRVTPDVIIIGTGKHISISIPLWLEEKEWCHSAIHQQDFYVTKSLQLRQTCELILINFVRVHHSVGSFVHSRLALATRSYGIGRIVHWSPDKANNSDPYNPSYFIG